MAVTKDDVQDATGQRTNVVGRGFLRGIGIGAQYLSGAKSIGGIPGNPIQGEIGYAPGATFQNPLTAIPGNMLWYNNGSFQSANWLNIEGVANPLVVVAAGPYTVTPLLNAGRLTVLNNVVGFTATLPPATGTGNVYQFLIESTVTTPSMVISRGVAADAMFGSDIQTGAAGAVTGFSPAAGNNTITLNGTTTGGFAGDIITLTDVALNYWSVNITTRISGTAATPFSTT